MAEVISIVVLGEPCGLKNMKQVHQWAENKRTREFLRKEQGIERIPCYYWFLCLLKLVKPESLNRCLKKWAERLLPTDRKAVSMALDGKTIRSTGKMDRYESSLHIVSTHLCEMGITLDSRTTDGKSGEIPAIQELLKELDISGCMVVADALNCQKKTAKAVADRKGDYLLSVKGNHAGLEEDIEGRLCAGRFLAKIYGYRRPKRKEPGQAQNVDGIYYGRYCLASRQGEMTQTVLHWRDSYGI